MSDEGPVSAERIVEQAQSASGGMTLFQFMRNWRIDMISFRRCSGGSIHVTAQAGADVFMETVSEDEANNYGPELMYRIAEKLR